LKSLYGLALAAVTLSTASAALAATPAQIAAGKTVFKSSGCGRCHVLKAVNASGTVGPNLDTHHYSLTAITNQITSGGRFMPPFATSKGGSLSSTQIKNVAAFVYAQEHK
jgi:mono/diheme cytochrome c family protein